MPQVTVVQALSIAMKTHQAGDLSSAEHMYRQILRHFPDHPDALRLMGILANQTHRHELAETLMRKAVEKCPDQAQYHLDLGMVLLGGEKYPQAIVALEVSLAIDPRSTTGHNLAGIALSRMNRLVEAIGHFRKAVEISPCDSSSWINLASAFSAAGLHADAEEAARKALSLKPDSPSALVNLSNSLKARGDYDGAEMALQNALSLSPEYAQARNNLANLYKDTGDVSRAIEEFVIALELNPNDSQVHSNLLMAFSYAPEVAPDVEKRWKTLWATRFAKANPALARFPRGGKPRMGFISPDFRVHPVGQNLLPLLEHLDRDRWDLYLYSISTQTDALTKRFQSLSTVYRNIAEETDDQAEEILRGDQLDILVDLALHTAGNRLPLVSRKPARVCLSWAGYPGTTGVPAIDYALSDPYIGRYDSPTLTLPRTFWCYDPLADDVPVGPLPAAGNGFVTFGSLNNFCKINPPLLKLWSEILGAVPQSRLLILSPGGLTRRRVVDALKVDSSRVLFHSKCPRDEFLRLHDSIDLMLDAYPYNGHTSSLDSFFMGVPVVTRVGDTPVSRGGWSLLNNLGLTELAGRTDGEYVSIAVSLSKDISRLQSLRAGLRDAMRKSPLMDGETFAVDFSDLLSHVLQGGLCG